MRHIVMGLALAAVFLVGCSEDRSKFEVVPIEKVPDMAMKVAKEKLPGVTFQQAWKKPDGTYEIRGKDANGKVREIELTEQGEVKEIE
jgi:hypothetical protein